jgi:hypothetical protein
VNRKAELLAAWEKCAGNVGSLPLKPYLLVSGQMWGSGKTTFGKHLFNFQNHYIEDLLNAEPKLLPEAKAILRNTLPVSIDLQDFKSGKFESTCELVSQSIFVMTLSQYFNVDIAVAEKFWEENLKGKLLGGCANLLLSMAQKPLFFHFDEVGELTGMEPSFKKQPLENGKVKGVFYQFWGSVANVQMAGCFAYVCGRSTVLNFFGTHAGEAGSVGIPHHVRLSLFKVEDLRDILWDKEPTTIGARLNITTEEEAERVAKWMHHLTTGVPRYVEYGLAEMIKMTDEAKELIDWGDSHEREISSILRGRVLIPTFNKESSKSEEEITRLVELASLAFPLSSATSMYGNKRIRDLVNHYGFYFEAVKTDPNLFTVKIPRLWIEANVFAAYEVRRLIDPPIDNPKALEMHVERIIVALSKDFRSEDLLQSSRHQTVSVSDRMEFLSNTLVANELFPPLELVMMQDRASKNNRQKTFDSCVDLFSPVCSLVRPMDKSSLPDLITVLPISDEGDRYLIGWQMKNYRKIELGVSSLQVELEKFTSHLSGQGCKGGVFVIVLNGKGDETVERFRGKVIRSEDMESTNALGLTLPSNVQVVIPTLQQLEKFLGEDSLKKLKRATDRTKSVVCIEGLKPEFGKSPPLGLKKYQFLVRMSDGSVEERSYGIVRDSKEFKEFLKTTDKQVQSHFLKNRTAQVKATYVETPGMSLNDV